MEQWCGTTAIVTGASSGIGAAIAKKFVESGINVVGIARRLNLLQELSEKVSTDDTKLYPIECDVTDENQILNVFEWIQSTIGAVSILVNNAGIYNGSTTIDEGDIEIWKQTISTNCIALSIFTREAIKSMKAHNIDGLIINISSITARYVVDLPSKSYYVNVYPASKHAVRALTDTLRYELRYEKSRIKITSISPGITITEVFRNHPSELLSEFSSMPFMQPDDVADAALYILSTPSHLQVNFVKLVYFTKYEEEEEQMKRAHKRKRRFWVHDMLKKRNEEGEFATLHIEDKTKFFTYYRMSRHEFNILLQEVEGVLQKENTTFRESIQPVQQHAVCLR
ncbi:hypothetical protein FQA39_LY11776 [Lamprigera yunnana]|nr:hypothetical protein FQA39_LY11776 [Lamprigera yunnana]